MDSIEKSGVINSKRRSIIALLLALFFLADSLRILLFRSTLLHPRSYVPVHEIPSHWAASSLDAFILVLFLSTAISQVRSTANDRTYLTLFWLIGASGTIPRYLATPYATWLHWLQVAAETALVASALKLYETFNRSSHRDQNEDDQLNPP